jgi:hypothetical protein
MLAIVCTGNRRTKLGNSMLTKNCNKTKMKRQKCHKNEYLSLFNNSVMHRALSEPTPATNPTRENQSVGRYEGSELKKGILLHAFHSTYVYVECYYIKCTVNLIRDTRLQFRMITGKQSKRKITLGVESQDQFLQAVSFPRFWLKVRAVIQRESGLRVKTQERKRKTAVEWECSLITDYNTLQ